MGKDEQNIKMSSAADESVLLYCPDTTKRVEYAFRFITGEITNQPFTITHDREAFQQSEAIKINYSREPLGTKALNIFPIGLLQETGIRPQSIQCVDHNEMKIFFQTDGDLGFDIFSAIFYLLSRYEEYLPYPPDKYGRFPHTQSLAFQNGFYQQPLINEWLQQLQTKLSELFPAFKPKEKHFQFLPTYDIDISRSYLHKGFLRNSANLVKEVLLLKWGKAAERLQVLSDRKKDPYDTFNFITELHHSYNIPSQYFFLVARRTSQYDKNIPPLHPQQQKLIRQLAQTASIGLHPSWQSNTDARALQWEHKTLSEILGQPVTTSRQHYLKLNIPDTYRALLSLEVTDDYTMGHAGINGFRASIASPFKWYDLEKETETNLTIHPFCFMDATAVYYDHNSPQQAFEELQMLYHRVKKVNGFFCMIWHNSSFCDKNEFSGWRDMYASFLHWAGQQ
ncbi:MAG: polysaccharide deacetylase family protein [Niabella sp.]